MRSVLRVGLGGICFTLSLSASPIYLFIESCYVLWNLRLFVGMGRMETNRTVYEGEWFDGKKEGFGTLYVKEKGGELRRVYKGDWMEGKRNVRFISTQLAVLI